MARKEFTYRGKTLDELKAMDLKQFSQLLPSRQRKSVLKGLSDVNKKLLKDLKTGEVKTHNREIVIIPDMVGKTVKVYNGKEFVPVMIITEMLGHYLGEFALTRKKVVHHAPGIGATKSSAALSVK
ncbi:30S ribosomal protein S19 [Candidatus Woesearchaeota archaeon]|nr:30S ribosomal protein S19 [Candidatus Woesearchaeota archaeon]